MTKKIEETLNLPSMDEALAALNDAGVSEDELVEEEKTLAEKTDEIQNLRSTLANLKISSFTVDDTGINEIRDKALSAYQDMLDAGFNTDSKYASNFLEPAVAALGIAMDTENTKLRKKLEMYKLKQQDERLDLLRRKIEMEEKKAGTNADVMDDDGILMNRNELLKNLLSKE